MPRKKQAKQRDAFRRTSNAMFEKPAKRTTETSWWIGANREEFRLRAGLALPLHVSTAEERNHGNTQSEPDEPDTAAVAADKPADTDHAAEHPEHTPNQHAALGTRDRQG